MRARGRISLMAVLCDACWNRAANDLAADEGATAAPRPDPDPEDTAWIEPAPCRECGAEVRVFPTNYDRWIVLATVELPAKDVPPRFRWRLVHGPDGSVAVRVRGIEPALGDPVVPDHRMLCPAEEASARP